MSNVNNELAELLAEMKAYGEANHVPIININGLAVLEKAVAARKPRREHYPPPPKHPLSTEDIFCENNLDTAPWLHL